MSTVLSRRVEIRFATKADIEPICGLLGAMFRRSTAFWRSVMNYPWLSDDQKPHYGAVLLVDGKPHGFNGVIFANRRIGGRLERFAGGFGWCVEPAYRRYAVSLLTQLKDPDVTWTNLTCRPELIPLFLRMGYSYADTRKLVCYPRPGMFIPRRRDRVRVVSEDEITQELLGPDVSQIYGDHFMSTVQRTMFEAGGRYCLVITRQSYAPTRLRTVPGVELYYSSDREFFARYYDQVLLHLLKRARGIAMLAEERLLDFIPKGAGTMPTSPLFKSSTVPAAHVDSLYSELVLLT